MTIEVVFKLPIREQMEKRLNEIRCTENLRKHFFPLLIKHAGEDVSPEKFVDLLVGAFHDYAQMIQVEFRHSVKTLLYTNAVWFIRALVDDEAVAREFKKHFILLLQTL